MVRARGRWRANDWAGGGRVDHGQFFLEMYFLHQRTGGDHFASADKLLDQRPAVHEEVESESGFPDRLHRYWVDQPGSGKHADHSGQRAAGGLVLVEIYCRFLSASAGGKYCGDSV